MVEKGRDKALRLGIQENYMAQFVVFEIQQCNRTLEAEGLCVV